MAETDESFDSEDCCFAFIGCISLTPPKSKIMGGDCAISFPFNFQLHQTICGVGGGELGVDDSGLYNWHQVNSKSFKAVSSPPLCQSSNFALTPQIAEFREPVTQVLVQFPHPPPPDASM